MTKIPSIPLAETKQIKTVEKLTAIRNKVVVLPESPNYIMQNNDVTNTIFEGFTLIQFKVFASIMLALQDFVKANYAGNDYKQLSLFDKTERRISLQIPLKPLSKSAANYDHVKDAVNKLSEISVKVPTKDEKGNKYYYATSLISALIPEHANYSQTIRINIEETIADFLILIKGRGTNSIQYTRYMYEIALQARSVYTIPVYMLLASYREKQGFRMAYSEFRQRMGIKPGQYTKFSDFKRKVLLPVQKDLYEKSDCWFNCNTNDFKVQSKQPDGTEKIILHFKVITPKFQETMLKMREAVVNLLSRHFYFKDEQLNQIAHILENENIPTEMIMNKIMSINEFIEASFNSSNPVKNKTAYALKALLDEKF